MKFKSFDNEVKNVMTSGFCTAVSDAADFADAVMHFDKHLTTEESKCWYWGDEEKTLYPLFNFKMDIKSGYERKLFVELKNVLSDGNMIEKLYYNKTKYNNYLSTKGCYNMFTSVSQIERLFRFDECLLTIGIELWFDPDDEDLNYDIAKFIDVLYLIFNTAEKYKN